MINFTVHRNAEHEHRVRTALDTGLTNKHARTDAPVATPAPVGGRLALLDRLGVTDSDISDQDILATLDALTAAKAVTPAAPKAKRAQPDAAQAAYDKAWGSTATAASTRIVTADDALYELAWGNDKKRA